MDLIGRLPFKYYPFVLLVILAAGFVGWYFGDMSQRALYGEGNEIYASPEVVRPGWLGGLLGAVFGVMAGVPYSLKLAEYRGYQSAGWIVVHGGIKLGCVAGVGLGVVSSIVCVCVYQWGED